MKLLRMYDVCFLFFGGCSFCAVQRQVVLVSLAGGSVCVGAVGLPEGEGEGGEGRCVGP